MAIELTRRIFLIGSAAAVAVAAAPLSPFEVQPVPALQTYLKREIIDIWATFSQTEWGNVALIEIVVDGKVRFKEAASPMYGFRTSFLPGEGIELLPSQTFQLVCASDHAIGEVGMVCSDTIDDGRPIMVLETHTFPCRGPARILPMRLEDAERLERHKVAEL